MANNAVLAKLADIPLAKPGFDALGMSAPVLVQLNPNGKWENCPPEGLEEEKLQTIIQQLVKSNTLSAAQSYCSQCAAENKLPGTKNSNYVPVIMMPIYNADQCPFDMKNCEMEKNKEGEPKTKKKSNKNQAQVDGAGQVTKAKPKKRGFVMQRLTDFDLLSQW